MEPITFGRWIKRLRAAQDLTQEKLSELVGCATPTLRAIELGARRPSREMAERIAEVLKVPADQRAEFLRLARLPMERTADEPPNKLATSEASSAPQLTSPIAALLETVNPLIGREAEVNALQTMLLDERQRLVTIVGAGGMGKTHLALALTANLTKQFPDGAGFVALASISQVQHLPSTIAASLNIPLRGATDLQQQVNAWLAPRRMLLTLDNFEQLLTQTEVAAWVRELLTAAPRLHLLITSRERLRVSGERVFELSGLSLPKSNQPFDIAGADAALLFLERARQADHTFTINSDNQGAISRICHLVGGMPLGIELAAAWVNVLLPTEIADEISRSIDFLALSHRDMLPRHRSMRAVFDHSWKLLSMDERSVLMKLSIFQGGCTREAAQQVAGATLPILANLIDKSLLHKSQTTPTRYTMHDLVRQYTADHLCAEPDKTAAVADAHATYYHQFVREAERQIWGAHIAETVSRLEAENDNLRVVLNHYLTDPAAIDHSVDLAGLLWRFWDIRGYITEGRAWLERALQRRLEPASPSRWLALHGAGNLANNQGDYAAARQHYQESLELLQAHLQSLDEPEAILRTRYRIAITLSNLGNNALARGDLGQALALSEEALTLQRQIDSHPGIRPFNNKIGIAITTTNLAKIKLLQHQYDQAERVSEESLVFYRGLGDERGIGWNLATLGAIARERGDYVQAAQRYQEARLLFEKLSDQTDMVTLYIDLGELARQQGDYPQAEAYYQAGLTLAQALGNKKEMALIFERLSVVACQERHYEQAVTWSEQSIALYREIGNLFGLGDSLHSRGKIAYALGAYEAAARYFKESLQLKAQVDNHHGIIASFQVFAALALTPEQQPDRAARLLGAAEKLRQTGGIGAAPNEAQEAEILLNRVRASLDQIAFATAWATGRAMTLGQSIAYAGEAVSEL